MEAIIVCWDKDTERYEAMEFHLTADMEDIAWFS